MARNPLYSRSPQRPAKPAAMPTDAPDAGPPGPGAPGTDPSVPSPLSSRVGVRLAGHPAAGWRRHQRLLAGIALLACVALAGWPAWTARVQHPLTIAQIDAALRESIAKQPLASAGLDNAQVEAVWSDIAAKRKVARYLHMAPVLVE